MDANTYALNQHLKQEEDYLNWLEHNEEQLIELYKESIEWDNVPDGWLSDQYNNGVFCDRE